MPFFLIKKLNPARLTGFNKNTNDEKKFRGESKIFF